MTESHQPSTPPPTSDPAPEVPRIDVPVVNILIVDDEPKNLTVLESVLDDPGYRLVRATSGEEALLALMAEDFAVLVLDVRMPGMSGFEVAQMVKERRKTARIPIIFLTAYYNEDQHILEGYVSGAVDYLHKPVNPAVLRSKVAVFAELHRRGLMLESANTLLLGEVAERRSAEAQLSELNRSLDQRVSERTAELEASQDRLLEANRRKDEFLATLAHELRNPLAPVRNAIEIFKRKADNPATVQWVMQIIDRQVNTFTRLIDDLMDVSRINQGRIELVCEQLSLGDVMSDAVEAVRADIQAAGHELSVLLPPGSVGVNGDRVRLTQAMVNLLTNASKYTDRGGRIEVGAAVERNRVVVAIRDTGIGIDPENLDRVFELFSQVESALARSRGGLGIGLSLTRRLIRMHGGEVRASSEGLGKGSCFSIELPLAPVDAHEQPAPEAAPVRSGCRLSAVVADDNADAAETLRSLLELQGHQVTCVYDGLQAVHAVLEKRPRLAVLDIGMPVLNGYDAARQIRARLDSDTCFLVAMTGWGQKEDVARAMAAGFDRHMVKPLVSSKLDEILATLCDPSATRLE